MSQIHGKRGPLAVLLLASLCRPAAAEESYELGHGLNVGDFNIAGYLSLDGDLPYHDRKALGVDDLSLYVTGHLSRWINPFFEGEANALPILHGGTIPNNGRANLALERLYNDAQLSDSLILRAGKMLTPVGEWNQIHAAPLVPTTTRPLSTNRSFDPYTSGVSLLYSGFDAGWPEVQTYWQPGRNFAEPARTDAPRRYQAFEGLHLNWPIGLLDQIGASVQRARTVGGGGGQTLYGLNARSSFGDFTVEGEGTYTHIDGGTPDMVRNNEWGFYALGSYAVTEELSLFSWYEQFRDRAQTAESRDLLFGLSYRPQPPLVWKIEYLRDLQVAPNSRSGIYASVSVLF